MSGRFFDTNVLVYSDDGDSPDQRERALELFAEEVGAGRAFVSTQVLHEYFVTATGKLGVPVEAARRKVELLAGLNLVILDGRDSLAAIDLHRLHGFSFWDALIVRAAQRSGCDVLYTEDLQHGRQLDGLRIENPFV
jgi:predicted nucleic acid-binding protein